MNPQDPNVIEEPTPQNSGAVEPILESILENQAQNGEAANQLLETAVEQNGETNNLLESSMRVQAETHEAVKESGEKVAQAVKELARPIGAAEFIASFMAAIKGDKGDKGDTPVKGQDYYTPQEIEQIAKEIENSYTEYDEGYAWAEDNDISDFDDCQNEFGTGDAEDGCNEYIKENYTGHNSFGGYECTEDCSGHEAGYNWAEENGVTDTTECDGNSDSFIEGCYAFVEENY